MENDNQNFRHFVRDMAQLLRENRENDSKTQEELLNRLFELENKFRTELLSTDTGKNIYNEFIRYILEDKGNILSAMTFFREDQDTFSKHLSSAFNKKKGTHKPSVLYKFKINYLFAQWVLERYRAPNKPKLRRIFKNMGDMRKLLCENNLPLAINRAKIFSSKISHVHLEHMDIVQVAAEGLMTSIDKFVPPYKSVFRSVAIGRMNLNMITENSTTLIKLPPKERRILYRYNLARKEGIYDEKEILKFICQSFPGVTKEKLAAILLAANNLIGMDDKQEGSSSVADKLCSDDDTEDNVVQADLKATLKRAVQSLLVSERKVVRLKNGL